MAHTRQARLGFAVTLLMEGSRGVDLAAGDRERAIAEMQPQRREDWLAAC